METMKEVCQAALETKLSTITALLLDKMLLEAEEKMGMMDGVKMEDWIISEVNE